MEYERKLSRSVAGSGVGSGGAADGSLQRFESQRFSYGCRVCGWFVRNRLQVQQRKDQAHTHAGLRVTVAEGVGTDNDARGAAAVAVMGAGASEGSA
jgi:hypothetical protein